jgi:hypothetical protein
MRLFWRDRRAAPTTVPAAHDKDPVTIPHNNFR